MSKKRKAIGELDEQPGAAKEAFDDAAAQQQGACLLPVWRVTFTLSTIAAVLEAQNEAKKLRSQVDQYRALLQKATAKRELDCKAALTAVGKLLEAPSHKQFVDNLSAKLLSLPDHLFGPQSVMALLESEGCAGLSAAQARNLVALLKERLSDDNRGCAIQHVLFSRVLDRGNLDMNGIEGYYHPETDQPLEPLIPATFAYRGPQLAADAD